MGGGSWTKDAYVSYSKTMCRSVSLDGDIKGDYSAQEMFKQRSIAEELKPYKVIRECVDSEEHKNTIPVILALDVTGSMGQSAVEVAKRLNTIMTKLYAELTDIEFMIMAIGDLAYDKFPIQASQFESDIRIAEQLDKVYFEGGGGGNSYESYTAAWLFGSRHTKLDCWKRGKKGLIITIGDEEINPYLPKSALNKTLTDEIQTDIETSTLYNEVKEKYNLFHLNINDTYNGSFNETYNVKSFTKIIGEQNVKSISVNELVDTLVNIIKDFAYTNNNNIIFENSESTISW
jgi:hypothetical protein